MQHDILFNFNILQLTSTEKNDGNLFLNIVFRMLPIHSRLTSRKSRLAGAGDVVDIADFPELL